MWCNRVSAVNRLDVACEGQRKYRDRRNTALINPTQLIPGAAKYKSPSEDA